MRARTALLWLCCLVIAGVGIWVATQDQHYVSRNNSAVNCGNALIATDTSLQSFSTGNVDDDNFAQDDVVLQCDHVILGRRILSGSIFLAAIAVGVMAARSARRQIEETAIPGTPIV